MSDQSSAFSFKRSFVALITGVVFGLGLSVAGMTDPDKVLGFLDVAGQWDPSLLLVLGGAVVFCFFGFRLILRRQRPVFDVCFALPKRTDLDSHLIVGSVLFGVGWGLAGYCPGPIIASVGFGNAEAAWFLPAMFAGMFVRRYLDKSAKTHAPAVSDSALATQS